VNQSQRKEKKRKVKLKELEKEKLMKTKRNPLCKKSDKQSR